MENSEIAQEIISTLQARGGFDGWWDDIDHDIRQEIIQELAAIVGKRDM